MIYFTSDLHLYHDNILKFCSSSRPFETMVDMMDKLKNVWNETIKPEDDVYILGDVLFKNVFDAKEYIDSLNGKKYLIFGNHDHEVRKNTENLQDCFVWCKDYYQLYNGKDMFVLSHYPFVCWNKSEHGSYHLYGHCHGTYVHDGKALDVGLDANDFKILSIEEIVEKLKHKPNISRY